MSHFGLECPHCDDVRDCDICARAARANKEELRKRVNEVYTWDKAQLLKFIKNLSERKLQSIVAREIERE
jgi:hypothetical protein